MLAKQISTDYIQAMKSRDSLRSTTLNLLRSQIKNVMIDKRVEELDDPEVVAIIKKQVKQRQDSIRQFTDGNRKDLADKEQAELDILKAYLPEEMPLEQIEPIVRETAREIGAGGMKDMGALMKAVLPKFSGKADSRMVSESVKKILGSM